MGRMGCDLRRAQHGDGHAGASGTSETCCMRLLKENLTRELWRGTLWQAASSPGTLAMKQRQSSAQGAPRCWGHFCHTPT